MENEIFAKIKSKLKNLPTLPVVASKILEVTENPETTVNDVKEIIMVDQVVASRLLRAVNSAYYGFPRQIDSLSQAIVILGFNNVRSLALSVAVMDLFSPKVAGAFDHKSLWRHSVSSAFIARALAKSSAPLTAEQCFVAALLHDIGFVLVDQVMPAQLKMVMSLAVERNIQIHEAEQLTYGFTHADVGGYMAEQWLLPNTLREAIATHHSPTEEPASPHIVFSVHAADIIARHRKFSSFENDVVTTLDSIDERAKRLFNIKDKLSDDAEEFLADGLHQARGFINIFGD